MDRSFCLFLLFATWQFFRGSIVIAIRFEQDALIRKFFVKVLDKHRLVNIPRVCIKCSCIALIRLSLIIVCA